MFIKKYLALVALSAIALSAHAEESKELKFLGKTVIHENGSWVNPDEPKFEASKPSTWLKRNYVRHYMQGSQEITDSIIKVDWVKFKEAAKTGEKVKLNEVVSLFKFKNTITAVKQHPEAVAVPVGMAAGSAVEGGKGTVIATVGLAKNVLTTTLKVIKFVSTPVRKIVPIKVESTNTNN
jgi:hypothetical protein|tara:strand:+ start:1222 stop:1761 length:540 start_codon:yes stop_codon:yes gene_type:complete